MRDWFQAVAIPATIGVGLSTSWATAYFDFLNDLGRARSAEERLKAQETWLRECLNRYADFTVQFDSAALASAKKAATDVARTLEMEAVDFSGPVL
jgi:hypothetical protein